MQFTRLRLLGFKSFVDPTELVIAPGLTGVVGPNGCGKSNLLEALRWVMGENRARSMRGTGMEDVIFAGSAARPQRQHAEVVLTLDNRARLAPTGFNDSDVLEVVRRITRDAGSAYRANGKEARARDVQMLFADASTGAHSPALVGQGRIAELINAKPKSRRRVLEEAAGISGLYQRRHEAELKLNATETNLGRVGDVLDALEAQIASLARQARQAARYREIADSLRRAGALLVWRQWYDADAERAATASALLETTKAAAQTQSAAGRAGLERDVAEKELPDLREEDAIAGAVLQRLTIERDRLDNQAGEVSRRISDLRSKLQQIDADKAREASLDSDAANMIGQLAEEQATLIAESDGHNAALAAARITADRAAEDLKHAERAHEERAEVSAKLVAEFQAASQRLEGAGRRSEQLRQAVDQAESALRSVTKELNTAKESRQKRETVAGEANNAAATAERSLAEAETVSGQARKLESEIRADLADAEGREKALSSEVAGLTRLLARQPGTGEQVLDSVNVAEGYETALGAALGDDLTMPALGPESSDSGWFNLDPLADARPLPQGVEPLSNGVTAPDALARRLDAIGVVERDKGTDLQASLGRGQRLVSLEGDLWRWDGLRVAAGKAPSASALTLKQKNRLASLKTRLSDAEEAARQIRNASLEKRSALEQATANERKARTDRKSADQTASEAGRALTLADAAVENLKARTDTLNTARARRIEEMEEAKAEFESAKTAATSLEDPASARNAVTRERAKVEAARIRMLTFRTEADQIDRVGSARDSRINEIIRESDGWKTRQKNASGRLADLERRSADTDAALAEALARPDDLNDMITKLAGELEIAEQRRRKAADRLAQAETALRDLTLTARSAEKSAGEAREARARTEALSEAAAANAAAASERVRAETGRDPDALLSELSVSVDDVPPGGRLEDEVNRLKRQRDSLGAVNLRAEEDAKEVQVEYETLSRDRSELEEAISKLRHGIGNLNREGRERLLEAFEQVNKNFTLLFKHLFGGGEASLVLVESDDPLEAGLEIMCQPPGKKLSTLSLLSGGEQTLTALSLIFAVFLANPSPICVLDEVDAPLDDANVTRFCDLLDEMTKRTNTRFMIITHHAITMARMDRLYGVTMAEQGVSQLVSVDLAAAEQIVETVA